MSADKSDRFSFPLLLAGQAQKEITHNEALILIDMLVHAQAQSASLSTPPSGATAGQCWIVGGSATSEWAGHEGDIAGMTSSGWRFVTPREGLRILVTDIDRIYIHNGSVWNEDNFQSDGFYVSGQQIIGARQAAIAGPSGGGTVDAEARTAITQVLTVLRTHGIIET